MKWIKGRANAELMPSANQGSCGHHFLKVLWYGSTRGMSSRSTNRKAGALATLPSRQQIKFACNGTLYLSLRGILFVYNNTLGPSLLFQMVITGVIFCNLKNFKK